MARTKRRYYINTQEATTVSIYRTGVYVRLSKERTESWRNKSQSLETQESLARAFAEEHGLTVVKCYVDYEYSGTTLKRPAFQEMLSDVKAGKINCILIRDLSRLGRDYIEMGKLIDKVFPFLGVRFISINDHLDTLRGMDEKKSFEVEIKNLVNDLYSKDISKKVIASHVQKARQGYFISGFAPYGYHLDKQNLGNKLIIDEVVKPILDKVFTLFLTGYSSYKICDWLNENKIATPISYRQTGELYRSDYDTKRWSNTNLRRMINNQVYIGNLVQRKGNKNLPDDDYIYYKNAHEPYISPKEYETIIKLIASRKTNRKSEFPWIPNRYKGLIYLKGSTRQMSRQRQKSDNKKNREGSYYFRDYLVDGNMKKKSICINETVLDRIVVSIIQTELERIGAINELLPSLKNKLKTRIQFLQDKITEHKQQIIRLRTDISDQYASYSQLRDSREIFLSKKLEINRKIETHLLEIEQCEYTIRKAEEEHNRQVNWLKTLDTNQESLMLTSEVLNTLIERIEIDENRNISVTFHCNIGGADNV